MVVHQHPSVNPPTVTFAYFAQPEQESFPVIVILKKPSRHPHRPSIGEPLPDIGIQSHEACTNRNRMMISDNQIIKMHYLTLFTSVQVSRRDGVVCDFVTLTQEQTSTIYQK